MELHATIKNGQEGIYSIPFMVFIVMYIVGKQYKLDA